MSNSPAEGASEAELRSFVLEVTARQPNGVADATDASTSPLSIPTAQSVEVKRRRPRTNSVTSPIASDAEATQEAENVGVRIDAAADASPVPQPSHTVASAPKSAKAEANSIKPTAAPELIRPVEPIAPAPPQRSLPAWFASLSVHLTMLAVLATVSLATVDPPRQLEMIFDSAPASEVEEVVFEEPAEPIVDATADVGALVADEIPSEVIDPGAAAFGGFSLDEGLGTGLDTPGGTAPIGTPGGGGLLGEAGSLLGAAGGTGTGTFGSGLGAAPTAKFFGAEIAGRRIVFVLDNSGSMQGGRLETVIAELLNCLDRLRDDQEFYILFHSDAVYPMLYPDPIDRYLRPTDANKRMVAAWLDTVELCLGDSVEDAINAAAMIEPDTVFLLSDGRIQGDNKFRVLMNGNARNFPIHTFAVGMNGSVAGRKNLQMIADANGGDFTESAIPPEMRDLSRNHLRPYHNQTPGLVWGRNVKPFKFGK
ncbi:hypothetical protein [Lacipirellula parvula]|uniref:VWFA domain-containing protein n=1 Tax=Lacipirellula parvula TaxID=2650471 RepID=A0A5K7XFE3_9BACT|nr:hypothetical protein [Lacipirellula parvula]BBO34757.1 hypothetical protein PLANPX_4369 [Lacipirellula parvula]